MSAPSEPPIKDNTCGTLKKVGVLFNSKGNHCFYHGRISVYHTSGKAAIVNPKS